MQLREIEQGNVVQILTRNSITQSNFLQGNNYHTQPQHRVVTNSQFTAWIFEESLDLSVLRQKLQQKRDLKRDQMKVYRSELRYLSNASLRLGDIEYHEKYKTFKLGSTFLNERVDQFDISQHFVVCLSKRAHLKIINMISNQQIQVQFQQEESFIQIIMCENNSQYFYILDAAYHLYQVAFFDGSISQIFFIQNYPLFVGNHKNYIIRLIRLKEYGYLLYSEQNYLFYFEANETKNTIQQNNNSIKQTKNDIKQTVLIKKSHFVADLTYNLIISEFNSNIFMINNMHSQKQYLLITRDTAYQENNASVFNSLYRNIITKETGISVASTPQASQLSAQIVNNSLEVFISKFDNKKEIYKLIRSIWCLKICKLFNQSNNDYYFYFFKDYIISEIDLFLQQQQIQFSELLQLTVILLMQIKPSHMTLLLSQLDTLIVDQKTKNEVWQKIWEFMPLYDVEREYTEPFYRQQYINICKMLGTEQEITFLTQHF